MLKVLRDCDFDLPTSPFGDFGDMLWGASTSIASAGGVLLEGGGSPAGGASIARLRDGFLEECRVSPGELIDVQQGRRDQEVLFYKFI